MSWIESSTLTGPLSRGRFWAGAGKPPSHALARHLSDQPRDQLGVWIRSPMRYSFPISQKRTSGALIQAVRRVARNAGANRKREPISTGWRLLVNMAPGVVRDEAGRPEPDPDV
jgi:hypothetical protein